MLCQFLPRTSKGRLFQFHSLFNHVSEPRFHAAPAMQPSEKCRARSEIRRDRQGGRLPADSNRFSPREIVIRLRYHQTIDSALRESLSSFGSDAHPSCPETTYSAGLRSPRRRTLRLSYITWRWERSGNCTTCTTRHSTATSAALIPGRTARPSRPGARRIRRCAIAELFRCSRWCSPSLAASSIWARISKTPTCDRARERR